MLQGTRSARSKLSGHEKGHLADLDRATEAEEEKQAVFGAKRETTLGQDKDVKTAKDRRLKIVFLLDLPPLPAVSHLTPGSNWPVGIYSDTLLYHSIAGTCPDRTWIATTSSRQSPSHPCS